MRLMTVSTEEGVPTPQRHRAGRGPLVGLGLVAVVGAGLGAYFGIRAVAGAGSAPAAGQPPARTDAAIAYRRLERDGRAVRGSGKVVTVSTTPGLERLRVDQPHPATSPPRSSGAQMTYDPVSRDVLLVGGDRRPAGPTEGNDLHVGRVGRIPGRPRDRRSDSFVGFWNHMDPADAPIPTDGRRREATSARRASTPSAAAPILRAPPPGFGTAADWTKAGRHDAGVASVGGASSPTRLGPCAAPRAVDPGGRAGRADRRARHRVSDADAGDRMARPHPAVPHCRDHRHAVDAGTATVEEDVDEHRIPALLDFNGSSRSPMTRQRQLAAFTQDLQPGAIRPSPDVCSRRRAPARSASGATVHESVSYRDAGLDQAGAFQRTGRSCPAGRSSATRQPTATSPAGGRPDMDLERDLDRVHPATTPTVLEAARPRSTTPHRSGAACSAGRQRVPPDRAVRSDLDMGRIDWTQRGGSRARACSSQCRPP